MRCCALQLNWKHLWLMLLLMWQCALAPSQSKWRFDAWVKMATMPASNNGKKMVGSQHISSTLQSAKEGRSSLLGNDSRMGKDGPCYEVFFEVFKCLLPSNCTWRGVSRGWPIAHVLAHDGFWRMQLGALSLLQLPKGWLAPLVSRLAMMLRGVVH
jgi:hypothetical protein